MKVFISYQIKLDENLASRFQKVLKKRGIEGIIASRRAKYDILIRDKIKEQIDESHFLVAILTKASLKSASVHEEIGYAIGTETPVALLVDEKLQDKEEGVLIHGHDYENFVPRFFEQDADRIAKYISEYTITKKIKKFKKVEVEQDQYQNFNRDKKLSNIRTHTVEVFKLHGFKSIIKKLDSNSNFYGERKVTLVENKKNKHRFFLLFFETSLTLSEIQHIQETISTFIFPNLSLKENWLNMCLVISYGRVTKTRIEQQYEGTYSRIERTRQNTTVELDKSTFYYGLGETQKLTKSVSDWLFPSSMPQFYASKIKSKNDIAKRLSLISDFIQQNKKIFKIIPKLKEFEYRYIIEPREKAEKKLEKERKAREKTYYRNGQPIPRRAAPRRRAYRR